MQQHDQLPGHSVPGLNRIPPIHGPWSETCGEFCAGKGLGRARGAHITVTAAAASTATCAVNTTAKASDSAARTQVQ